MINLKATFKETQKHNGITYEAGAEVPTLDLDLLRFWYQRNRIDVTGDDAILVTSKKLDIQEWATPESETPKKKTSKKIKGDE